MNASAASDKNGFIQSVVAAFENVSQKKRYEKSLLNDKLNLSSVIDSADIFVVNVDRNHSILFLNEKLKSILFDLTEIVVENGFSFLQLIPENLSFWYKEIAERGFNGEHVVTDESISLKGGKIIDLE